MSTIRDRSYPWLIGAAAALTAGVAAIAVDRWRSVSLPLADWRCTVQREVPRSQARAGGGVEYKVDYVCDQWSRR